MENIEQEIHEIPEQPTTPWWEGEQPPVLYSYHPVTGEYVGTCEASPSPLEPGVWLYPAHTTEQEPPAPGDGQMIIWTGENWEAVDLPAEDDGEQEEEKEPTDEQQAASVRAQRDALLREADILIFKAEDAGEDTTALRAYRQALRDVPEQPGFPWDVEWPEIPA